MNKFLLSIGFVMSVFASLTAFATKDYWSSHCAKEMAKFGCDPKGKDEEIYQCLIKDDADISKDCDNNAHSVYEKETGKSQ